MKKYDYFLFDADGTLFDFDAAEVSAFAKTFKAYSFVYTEEILRLYKQINEKAWADFELGKRSKGEIVTWRFKMLFEKLSLDCDPEIFNDAYLTALGEECQLIFGAESMLKRLKAAGKDIYIITNGVFRVQESRRKKSTIDTFITETFVSESIGFQKPDVRFFEHVLSSLPTVDKSNMLVIGDSLTADIKGGNLAGIDTVWFNPTGVKNHSDAMPTYEVSDLSELERFV